MSISSISLSGLQSAQTALSGSQDNIANLSTPGFSRRRTTFAASSMGGVRVSSLERVHDVFKTEHLWMTNAQAGKHARMQAHLGEIEKVQSIDGDDALGVSRFFDALSGASADPASIPLRQKILRAAESMSKSFASMESTLQHRLTNIHAARESMVRSINTLTHDIARLNQRIVLHPSGPESVPALLDQRDRAIDDLSKLVGVQILRLPDGAMNVTLRGGQPLVLAANAGQLVVSSTAHADARLAVNHGTQSFDVSGQHAGGELEGLDEVEREVIRPHIASLKTLGYEIAQQFNQQHGIGFDKSGAAGKPLFLIDTADRRWSYDPSFKTEDLAFSDDAQNPIANGRNLLALSELSSRQVTLSGATDTTLKAGLSALKAKLSAAVNENKKNVSTSEEMQKTAAQAWLSVSGVDLNEEIYTLTGYVKMQQANMKVMKTINDLFDTVLHSF